MKTRRSLLASLPVPFLLAGLGGPAAALARRQQDEEESPLGEAMERLNRGLRRVKNALGSTEDMQTACAEIGELQKAVIDAKSELPPKVAMIEDAAEKKAATIAFKSKMQDVVRTLLDLESALLNEDAPKAEEVLERLKELEREGHREFRPRRER